MQQRWYQKVASAVIGALWVGSLASCTLWTSEVPMADGGVPPYIDAGNEPLAPALPIRSVTQSDGGADGGSPVDSGGLDDGGDPVDGGRAVDGGSPVDGGNPVDSGIPAPMIDLDASSIRITPEMELLANLRDEATVTVTLLDEFGAAIPNVEVTLHVTPTSSVVVSPATPLTTNEEGRAIFGLTSASAGTWSVRAGGAIAGVPFLLGPQTLTFERCVSNDAFYVSAVEGPVLTRCVGCHNDYGRLQDNELTLPADYTPAFGQIQGKMRLRFADDEDAMTHNVQTVSGLLFTLGQAQLVDPSDPNADIPYVLAKPLGIIPHGGGVVLSGTDDITDTLNAWIDRLRAPPACLPEEDADLLEGVSTLPPAQVLRRASFLLLGRFPTEDERSQVGTSVDALSTRIADMMTEDAFYERLPELLNDLLLTEESNAGTRATAQLPTALFDNARKYFFRPSSKFNGTQVCDDNASQECCINLFADAAFCEAGETRAVTSVSREALALASHIVRNDLPFTEILTADYTMVNPYSAAIYGLWPNDDARFTGTPETMTSYEPAQIVATAFNSLAVGGGNVDAIPHAGILSTSTLLARYPTTNTNINRHRARHIFSKFLALDVMEFLNLVIDQDEELPDHLFTEARTCSACHAALDPVAGLYKNYYFGTRYFPRAWYEADDDIRPAGFRGEIFDGDPDAALPWLGQKIAEDERFALAVAKHMHGLLSGNAPVKVPTDPDHEDFEAQVWAFQAQTEYFHGLADRFRGEHNYNLKGLILDILLSPYLTAGHVSSDVGPVQQRALELAGVGAGNLITPEQLHRKLVETLGFPYHVNGSYRQVNQFLNTNRYRLLWGGIDSDVVLQRYRQPFPIMANVARRMSNEMACLAVPQDFSIRDPAARRLFQEVTSTTIPETVEGVPIEENVVAIRSVLRRLHATLLGEAVVDGDPALEESFDLFLDVYRAGSAQVTAGQTATTLPSRCRATADFYDSNLVYDAESATPSGDNVQVVNDRAYVIRAFMAVVSTMLSDYDFLFE